LLGDLEAVGRCLSAVAVARGGRIGLGRRVKNEAREAGRQQA